MTSFLKYTLIGNLEGIVVALLTYLFFKKIFDMNRFGAGNVKWSEKLFLALIYIPFYVAVFWLLAWQGNGTPGWPISDLFVLFFTVISFWQFFVVPLHSNDEN